AALFHLQAAQRERYAGGDTLPPASRRSPPGARRPHPSRRLAAFLPLPVFDVRQSRTPGTAVGAVCRLLAQPAPGLPSSARCLLDCAESPRRLSSRRSRRSIEDHSSTCDGL